MADSTLHAPLARLFSETESEERLQRVWRGIREQRESRRHAGFWGHHARLIVTAAATSTASDRTALPSWSWRCDPV